MFCPVFCLTATGVAHVEEKVYFKCLTAVIVPSIRLDSEEQRHQHKRSQQQLDIPTLLCIMRFVDIFLLLFIYL